LTDPDPNLLKSAAAYLVQVARSSKGGRFRKSAKIEALRECKEEILEAHRNGLSIHRIAQIFRERKVDISTQHLMLAIRLFIAEEERGRGKSSSAQERQPRPVAAGEEKKRSVTYEPLEQISPVVRRRSLLSNCGWRVIWPHRVLRRRGRWNRRPRLGRLKKPDPPQRRGLELGKKRRGKSLVRWN
jgi:hypothetical protein